MDVLNLVGIRKNKTILVADKELLQLLQFRGGELIFNENYSKEIRDNNLSEILRLSDYPVKRITLLIPGNRLLFSAFKIPREAQYRLEEIIDLKFLSKLSFPREDLYYSYYLVEDKENFIVLAFAVKREFINELYAICRSSGLKVDKILPLPFLYYLYHLQKGIEPLKYQGRTILYLDYDNNYGHFTIIGPEEPYLRGCLAESIPTLKVEIDKVLTHLTQRGEQTPILILNGKEINLGSEVNASYIEMVVNEKNLTENYQKHIWIEINNLLDGKKGKQLTLDLKKKLSTIKKNRQRKSNLGICLLVGVIILLNILTLVLKWQMEKERLQLISEKLALVSYQAEEVTALKEKYSLKREQLELYKGILKGNKGGYLVWLAELSKLLPPETEVNTLNFQGKKLTLLEGKATSASLVLGKLETSPYFLNLKFLGSIDKVGDSEFFKIAGELQDDIK